MSQGYFEITDLRIIIYFTYSGAVVANAACHFVKGEGGHLKKNPKESLFTGVFSVVVVAACDKDALDLVMFERMVS